MVSFYGRQELFLPGIHPFRALEKKKNLPILAKTGKTGYNSGTGMALNHYK